MQLSRCIRRGFVGGRGRKTEETVSPRLRGSNGHGRAVRAGVVVAFCCIATVDEVLLDRSYRLHDELPVLGSR